MPRIKYAQEGSEAHDATPVYQQMKKGFGMVPNIVKLVGHSGPVTRAVGAVLNTYFNELQLQPRIREMAYLTVARLNNCQYCQGHHTGMAKQAGMSDEEIALLGPNGFSDSRLGAKEQAVIRFAYETTRDVAASDEAVEALKKHFSLAEIAEIAFVVAAGNFIQRIGKNFGAELEMSAAS